jgi:hypothetical protein
MGLDTLMPDEGLSPLFSAYPIEDLTKGVEKGDFGYSQKPNPAQKSSSRGGSDRLLCE